MTQQSILLDGLPVPFEEGQTIMDAAMAAEIFIPHLCHHPEFKPQGSCKLCTVCLLYTSPSPRDRTRSRMPSSA